MRIRNNEPISFEEAKQLLASRNGSENLQRKIDTLAWLLNRHMELEPLKAKPKQTIAEPHLVECAECGEWTHLTGQC